MKKFLPAFFLLISFYSNSQEKFSNEISFITDNDLYISTVRDRYYTSGIFLSFRQLKDNKNNAFVKKIYEWKIGQEMYTPYKSTVVSINKHDRPFAGYLYGGFSINRFAKTHIFNTSIQLGVIGPNSYAEELQEFIHDIYGFKKAIGWEHQIKSAFALNFNAEYLKPLLNAENNHFDITWFNSLNFGTVYTNAASGFYSRIGFIKLQNQTNTIAFNSNLNNNKTNSYRVKESFLYFKTMLRYALYDATLQGSFLNKKSPVTKELVPLVFDLELGLKFTINQFSFGYIFNYNTSKSKELRYNYGNKYGSIAINYLFN